METNTITAARMETIIAMFELQTPFLASALDGISEADAHQRLNTKANHIAWLTGSLVQQRYELANELGINLKQSADELFKNNQGIKDDANYPPLATYVKDWEKISTLLVEKLKEVTDAQLDTKLTIPGMPFSLYELITFIVYREANCIGQIALWRRLLGYPAMKYM